MSAERKFRDAIDAGTDNMLDEAIAQHRAQRNVHRLRAPRGGAADADEAEGSDADVKAASEKLADAIVNLIRLMR